MRTLGNILWYFPFFGFINAIMFFLLGSLLVLTVVASPLGLGLIQYSKFLFAPFSWSMVSKEDLNVESNPAWEAYSTIIMILWILRDHLRGDNHLSDSRSGNLNCRYPGGFGFSKVSADHLQSRRYGLRACRGSE